MATITVFVGSVRKGRQGRKVADWVTGALKERGHDVHLIDPKEHEDLLVMEAMHKSQESPSEDLSRIREQVLGSDGYIAVTPEYNHSYSGAIKNALDHFLEEYHFKPFCIVTYSAGGFGGIRAAEHLRCVLAEMGAPAIPSSLPISRVQQVFDDEGALTEKSYEARLAKTLDEFEWYVNALTPARREGTPY